MIMTYSFHSFNVRGSLVGYQNFRIMRRRDTAGNKSILTR